MAEAGLVVHSLTEVSLYLMLARCGVCADAVVPTSTATAFDGAKHLEIPVACEACGHTDVLRFDVSQADSDQAALSLEGWAALAQAGQAPPISTTSRPSQVIDVAGWLTLHARLTAAARARSEQAAAAGRTVARQLQIQAGECLEEALKFYDLDNDLPPEDAFFTRESRAQFREHPERFLRGTIASLRAKSTIKRGSER